MSLERIIRTLRNLKTFIKTRFITDEIKFKLEHNHKNVIDLDVVGKDDSSDDDKEEVVSLRNGGRMKFFKAKTNRFELELVNMISNQQLKILEKEQKKRQSNINSTIH